MEEELEEVEVVALEAALELQLVVRMVSILAWGPVAELEVVLVLEPAVPQAMVVMLEAMVLVEELVEASVVALASLLVVVALEAPHLETLAALEATCLEGQEDQETTMADPALITRGLATTATVSSERQAASSIPPATPLEELLVLWVNPSANDSDVFVDWPISWIKVNFNAAASSFEYPEFDCISTRSFY